MKTWPLNCKEHRVNFGHGWGFVGEQNWAVKEGARRGWRVVRASYFHVEMHLLQICELKELGLRTGVGKAGKGVGGRCRFQKRWWPPGQSSLETDDAFLSSRQRDPA